MAFELWLPPSPSPTSGWWKLYSGWGQIRTQGSLPVGPSLRIWEVMPLGVATYHIYHDHQLCTVEVLFQARADERSGAPSHSWLVRQMVYPRCYRLRVLDPEYLCPSSLRKCCCFHAGRGRWEGKMLLPLASISPIKQESLFKRSRPLSSPSGAGTQTFVSGEEAGMRAESFIALSK